MEHSPQKEEFILKKVIVFFPDGQEESFTKGEHKVKDISVKHAPAFKMVEVRFDDNTCRAFADFPFEISGELKQPSPIILPQESLLVPKK